MAQNRPHVSPISGMCYTRIGMVLYSLAIITSFMFPNLTSAQPPPPPAQSVYIVFYDYGRAPETTEEAKRVIKLAADRWRADKPEHVIVTGHTDTSISSRYEALLLSERMATQVAAALARYNIPRDRLLVKGLGLDEPRVPTPPGVPEPQNRRIEITFE